MVELCVVQDVKDRLVSLVGRSLPAECTDAKITDAITRKSSLVLEAFGVAALADLGANRQVVAKDAARELAAADLLRSFGVRFLESASQLEKDARGWISLALAGPSAATPSVATSLFEVV